MTTILTVLYFMVLFGVAYAVKGGQSDDVLTNWNEVRNRNKVLERLMDGKVLSTILVFLGVSAASLFLPATFGIFSSIWTSSLMISAMWLLAVSPSMGEEYGALLGKGYPVDDNDKGFEKIKIPSFLKFLSNNEKKVKNSDGEYNITYYLKWRKETEYGTKKAIQRGTWMGACMTVGTASIPFIYFSLLFVPLAFLALNYAPNKILDGWGWSEVAIGAICFGIPMGLI